jgi:adenine-specific DNA-methyltransferase
MDTSLLGITDTTRRQINRQLADTRAVLGQFMTPTPVASFMAGLFQTHRSYVRILDPGAGVGTLTAALLDRFLQHTKPPRNVVVTCYEIDARLVEALRRTLETCRLLCRHRGVTLTYEVRYEDYIEARTMASCGLFREEDEPYHCVIMNPPYRKINSNSKTRLQLRAIGIETSNVYSAFMLLAARQLAEGGEFVSISPRSFCNGPYFRRFRQELMRLLDVRHIHLFESRTDVFREDNVLQENVILYGVRAAGQSPTVEVSITSRDGHVSRQTLCWDQVVRPDDREAIIHIVTDAVGNDVIQKLAQLSGRLDTLGLSVSTGRVVDFRVRPYLRSRPGDDTAPLIYPVHFRKGRVVWPNYNTRKPNAIVACEVTANLLVPKGFYVLTKRFSAKEESRRIVAALYNPRDVPGDQVGFDNKTNYFHANGSGLNESLARGLVTYLNSTIVDQYFRLFSGHTQVNAADLRRIPYPTPEQLERLSTEVNDLGDQHAIDTAVEQLF